MDKYKPNHIPVEERLFNLVWGIGLLIISYLGYIEQSFYFPGRRGSEGITFEGTALWLFIAATITGAVNLFITVADHYDKRDNEIWYKQASRFCVVLGLALAISAATLEFAKSQKEPVVIRAQSS